MRGLLSLRLEQPAQCSECGEVYELAANFPKGRCCGSALTPIVEAYVCTGCRTNHLDPASARECCIEGTVR